MSAITERAAGERVTGSGWVAGERSLSDPRYQAFMLLRTVFTVAPIRFGSCPCFIRRSVLVSEAAHER